MLERNRLRMQDWKAMAELLAKALQLSHPKPPGMWHGCEVCQTLQDAARAGLLSKD